MTDNRVKVIQNAQIVLEQGILWEGALVVVDGRIVQIAKECELDIPVGAERIDAKGAYVGPGFVDIHVHGGNGYSTCYELKRAAQFFLSHGSTSILATPDYSMSMEAMLEAIGLIKASLESAPTVKGIYMEGPYTNPAYGANAAINPWRNGVRSEEYVPIVDAAGTLVKVWVIAPERPDLLPFLQYARKINPEVRFALGHSDATPAQIRKLGKYRPTLQTHSMNATGRQPVNKGTRSYGPDEYCLKEIDVYTELISDSCGIHVHPEMQQLLLHNKGVERVVLITDSTIFTGSSPTHLAHVKDLNFDPRGGIAGSKMTMEMACRNVMANTNCGIAQAFYMASTNPSRVLGMDDEVGSIEVGKRADLVIVDDKFNIQKVILGGVIQ